MATTTQYEEIRKAERNRRMEGFLTDEKLSPKQRETLKNFKNHLLAIGRTIETTSGYLHKIKLFGVYINKPYEKITKKDIDGFLAHYSDKAVSYLNGLRSSVSVFSQWILQIEKTDPLIKDLKANRQVKKKTGNDVLSQEDILKMANAAENFRNRFLVTGGYESACRKSEFIGLKIRDVEIKDKYALLHVDGKTGQRPVLIINSFPDLVNHLNHHPLREDNEAPLFLNHNGLAMLDKKYISLGSYGFNDILTKLSKTARIKKKVYPHILRHSRLTHLSNEGYTEIELRKIAGWTNNSSMADTYIHQNITQVMNKQLSKAGLIKETEEQKKQELMKPHNCEFCGETNTAGIKYCGNCGRPLIVRELLDNIKKEDVIMREAMSKDLPIKEAIKQVLKEIRDEERRNITK